MENKIRIPSPCNENWNSMSPDKKGRFCASCNKTVIDFTKMKTTEIQKYFVENANNESICGYYKSDQIENSQYSKLRNRFNQIKIRPIKIIALFSLSFLFTFTSCIMGKRATAEEFVENDTIDQNQINDQVQHTEKQTDSLKTKLRPLKEK